MAKVFNKGLMGTKVAVVVGREKAVRLADLIEKHLGYSDKARDIKTALDKFDGGSYAISLETGKYGKVDLYKKKGFRVTKWNDCLIDKEDSHAHSTPITDNNAGATLSPATGLTRPSVTVEGADVNTNVGVTVVFNGVDPQGLVRPTNKADNTNKNEITGGKIMKNSNKTLGGNMMERLMGKFGMVSTDDVRLTMTGALAFFDKKRDRWLSLGEGQLVDNFDLVMDFEGAFAMPVKKSDLKVGDLIITPAGNYSFLESVNPLKIMTKTGSISTIKEIGNIFGMEAFFTVIRPIFGGAVDGLNPMMFMLMKKDGNGAKDDKFSKLMMLQALGGNGGLDMSNPMVTMLLLDDKKSGTDMKDLMMLQAMSGGKGLDFNNPMVMMSLLGDGDFDMKDMMMFQAMGGATTGQAGAFNPMMLMAMSDKNGGKKMDMKDMLMFQAMGGATNGGAQAGGFDMSNPMTMMMLAGDGDFDMKDMLMFQAMGNANKPVTPVTPATPSTPTTPVADTPVNDGNGDNN